MLSIVWINSSCTIHLIVELWNNRKSEEFSKENVFRSFDESVFYLLRTRSVAVVRRWRSKISIRLLLIGRAAIHTGDASRAHQTMMLAGRRFHGGVIERTVRSIEQRQFIDRRHVARLGIGTPRHQTFRQRRTEDLQNARARSFPNLRRKLLSTGDDEVFQTVCSGFSENFVVLADTPFQLAVEIVH